MQAPRKNMERMEEHVVGANDQALQYMLTDAQWDDQAVMEQVAQEADQLLGGSEHSCLIIDESSFIKKGKHSVGVARQWCGRLGKVECVRSVSSPPWGVEIEPPWLISGSIFLRNGQAMKGVARKPEFPPPSVRSRRRLNWHWRW